MDIIDGNAIAREVMDEVRTAVEALDYRPCVAFVRVGEDPASVSYVRKKEKTAAELGIESQLHLLEESASQAELDALIDRLNADPNVHGILVQAPLPSQMDETATFNRVHPSKDVDGFSYANLGRLVQEDPEAFAACTPAGIVELLKRSQVQTSGKRVVVVGRSLIVGKPTALLLMRRLQEANATVTVCHSRTENLAAVCREADILVAAIGRPHFITADMVREGAVVIDVGINRLDDSSRKRGYRLVGDVDYDAVAPKCAKITPVPGGVGPMTVAMLMKNTLQASLLQRKDD